MVKRLLTLALLIVMIAALAGAGGTYKGKYQQARSTYSAVAGGGEANPYSAPVPQADKVLYYTATQSDKRNVAEPRDIGSEGFYDSLSTMDVVQFTMSLFDEDEQSEYTGMVDSLRSRNPDMIVIDYLYCWGVEDDWVDADSVYTAGNIRHDWYTFIDDHDYFTRKIDGNRAAYLPEALSNSWLINFGYSEVRADSMAQFFADYINASGNSRWYTGVYLDYFDYPDVVDWQCGYGACTDSIDLDYDGIPYDSDLDEQAIYQQGYRWFVEKLRDKIDHEKFIILSNASAHYKDTVFAGLTEGGKLENIESLYPSTRAQWVDLMIDIPAAYSTSVLSNPMILYDQVGHTDNREADLIASSLMSGIAGVACITNAGGVTRRFWTLEESSLGRISIGTAIPGGVGWAVGDTLYRQYSLGYARFVPDTTGVLGSGGFDAPEYVVVDTVTTPSVADTLLISTNWPKQPAPPAAPASLTIAQAAAGDLVLDWDDNSESELVGYTVWRGLVAGSLSSYWTGTPSTYTDTGGVDGTRYYYAVTAYDSYAQISDQSSVVTALSDATAPSAPTSVFASGGDGFIYIEWSDNSESDLASYSIYRRNADGSLALFDDDLGRDTSGYNDATVPNDSTYYYAVAAIDSSGNESSQSSEVSATAVGDALAWNVFTATTPVWPDTVSDGSYTGELTVTARTNRASYIRPRFHRQDGPYTEWTDTSGVAWMFSDAGDTAQIIWDGDYDTGVPLVTFRADSGGIHLGWTAATGHDGYRLQMAHNDTGSFWTVSYPHPDSTTFTHAADDDTLPPHRGKLNYRLYAFEGVPGTETATSAVALIDSVVYNQAMEVTTEFHAVEDTATYGAGDVVVSEERTALWITRAARASVGDVTPPDTTGTFVSMAYDTTTASNIEIDVTIEPVGVSDAAQAWVQWKAFEGGTWAPSEKWTPVTPSANEFTVSEATSTSTADAAGDTFYVRYQLRDTESTPNVSAWVNTSNGGTPIRSEFTRAAEAATDTHYYVFARANTAYTVSGTTLTVDSIEYEGTVHEYNDADLLMLHGWLDPSDATAVHPALQYSPLESIDLLPLATDQSPGRVGLYYFDCSDTLAGRPGTVDEAFLHMATNGSESDTDGDDGVFRFVAMTHADLDEWWSLDDGGNNVADCSYTNADQSAPTAWTTAWSTLSLSDICGTNYVDGPSSTTDDDRFQLEGFGTAVAAWTAGTSPEGGFMVYAVPGSGTAGSMSTYQIHGINGAVGVQPVLVVRMIQ